MPYAVKTTVNALKTRQEIEALIMKRKAKNFASFTEERGAMIAFELSDRRIVFRLPLPNPKNEQDIRSRWRGLLLTLKAKFESIDRGVETFDDAFLSHVMLHDGKTVGEHTKLSLPKLIAGEDVPLLPAPRST